MNNLLIERAAIVRSFNSVYTRQSSAFKAKRKTLMRMATVDLYVVLFLLVIAILVSAATLLRIQPIVDSWANAGLLVLMAMALSFRTPLPYLGMRLQNHIWLIEELDVQFNGALNGQLEAIVETFNRRRQHLFVKGLLQIVILLSALLHIFGSNPYWNYFPIPVLAVGVYLLVRIIADVTRLRRNLSVVEQAVPPAA